MHILSATAGVIDDGQQAIDVDQTPADILFLTSADTEISCFATAQDALIGAYGADAVCALRITNTLYLKHPYSVDTYVEKTACHAKIIVVRVLGGKAYFDYGIEQLSAVCHRHNIRLVLLPGDGGFDGELYALSTVDRGDYDRIWAYFTEGGIANAENALLYISAVIGNAYAPALDAQPLLKCGFYTPPTAPPASQRVDAPPVLIVFYRALWQAGNTKAIDALYMELCRHNIRPVCVYVTSLKDPTVQHILTDIIRTTKPDAILHTTGFALKPLQATHTDVHSLYTPKTPYDIADCPVYQVVFASTHLDSYTASQAGLSPRDVAMYMALPEVDGRIITHAVSFKTAPTHNATVQADIVEYTPIIDRVQALCHTVKNMITLRNMDNRHKRIALVFANYPSKDGRIANGVGLDTPSGALQILNALQRAGYTVPHSFKTGNDIVQALKTTVTNTGDKHTKAFYGKQVHITLSTRAYTDIFTVLSPTIQQKITAQWGDFTDDPYYDAAGQKFCLPLQWVGNMLLATQPARGYNIDIDSTYHDATLVPPHGYIATYAYISAHVEAVVHMGKHGNLEWLPGKALALSAECFPAAILAHMPHFYPFIVNDPGEGTQAKRRTHAVIIDHMTPPLTRAETYGDMKHLERVLDEYYTALTMDTRRVKPLQQQVIQMAQKIGIFADLQPAQTDDVTTTLTALDAYICDLKEMQIRDGLHIFGQSPTGTPRRDLLIALSRAPRHHTGGADWTDIPPLQQSFIRAMALDFGFTFDPLDCDFAAPHTDTKPSVLSYAHLGVWRTLGDTVERLEHYAMDIVDGICPPQGKTTQTVYTHIKHTIAPLVDACGAVEISAMLRGLNGQFVRSGAAGAPTRGRLDVLPTGKNFYSVDTRTVPTPTAWDLGWKSASRVIDTYVQEHGAYPRHMALSAWGTANMRTGGDDICQMLALLGAKPHWDGVSGKVTGFDILPISVLGRPRVDVVLRVSGFFRDAFQNVIDLVDSAVRRIATLDESYDDNPIKQKYDRDIQKYQDATLAGARVFGSAPGAYGAGMQGLIDSGHWQDDGDLAETYIKWGAFVYGNGVYGQYADSVFSDRLQHTDAILHNQDNREHDILDSDDYYQFQGGMAVAIRHVKGENPALYFNDHSKPFAPQTRTLNREISRVVRGRASNPKWIHSVMQHGYKGAFEISATVDYLYAYAATARAVSDHHFDQLFEAYINDATVYTFLLHNNPDALYDIAEKFQDAIARGLWRVQRKNSVYNTLQTILNTKHTTNHT